jgi:signal transduction histidine kinase
MATDMQHSLTQQIACVRARVAELQEAMCGSAPFQRELAPTAWDEITGTLETLQVAVREHEQVEAHMRDLNMELAQRIVTGSAQLAVANQLNAALRVDITEHQRREAQFLQVRKLERVGRRASGVAHDLNNLLTGVRGYIDLILHALSPVDQIYSDLIEAGWAPSRYVLGQHPPGRWNRHWHWARHLRSEAGRGGAGAPICAVATSLPSAAASARGRAQIDRPRTPR